MKPSRYSHWNTRQVGHMKLSVRPRPRVPYSVLRVDNLIDTGRGQRSVVLKNALPDFMEISLCTPQGKKLGIELPQTVSDLNCIYTGRGFGVITDVAETLQIVTRNAKLAAIVPDVIRPGDFMIYRHGKSGMRFAGVLRAVSVAKLKQMKGIRNKDTI